MWNSLEKRNIWIVTDTVHCSGLNRDYNLYAYCDIFSAVLFLMLVLSVCLFFLFFFLSWKYRLH